jgi:hypothetical protein
MMRFEVRAYTDADASSWDRFCDGCANATFLHTRRFLSYHCDRFRDASCIVSGTKGWLGLLPAAAHPEQANCVVSHPGVSYGGLLHDGNLSGDDQLAALAAIADYYRQLGHERLRYKVMPHIYQVAPAQDDLYGLFRLGASRYRCDLSSCIDLAARRPAADRRRRGLRKAEKAGLTVSEGTSNLPHFWPLLVDNLAQRHGVRPVHTLAEITDLANRFPEQIKLNCAQSGSEIVAGVLLFCTRRVHHAQYSAANAAGQEAAALDLVFEHCIEAATQEVRYFDFGISTEEEGGVLNSGLYRFKTEFGGGGVVSEFYELNLTSGPNAVSGGR